MAPITPPGGINQPPSATLSKVGKNKKTGKKSNNRQVMLSDTVKKKLANAQSIKAGKKSLMDRTVRHHSKTTEQTKQASALSPAQQKITETAQGMEGYYRWVPPAQNALGSKNDFEEMVNHGVPLGENSAMNCWESVFSVGLKSGVLPESDFTRALKDSRAMDSDITYNEKVVELLGMRQSIPLKGNTPEPGDLILFFGSSHVALAMGDDKMMHLPNEGSFQHGLISDFTNQVKGNDVKYAQQLKNGIEHLGDFPDEIIRKFSANQLEKMYDTVMDYVEVLRDDEHNQNPDHKQAVAKAKASAMKAVQPIIDQLAVRIVKNPWQNIQDVLKISNKTMP